MRFTSPTAFMAEQKRSFDFSGDIIGIPDNGNLIIGDTITDGEEIHFKGIPSFSPELFSYRKCRSHEVEAVEQGHRPPDRRGVAQLFTSSFNGRKILGRRAASV